MNSSFEKKKNRFIVENLLENSGDNSASYINSNDIELLGLFRGDTILLKGKKRKDGDFNVQLKNN